MNIRSFVLRQGRITEAQERAFTELWPQYGIELTPEYGVIDYDALFGMTVQNPVIEIGFGNGESLVHMAQTHPENHYIGIEVHRPGVGHAMLKAHELGVNNLKIIHADAVTILTQHIANNSLASVQIYFPDPWPKKRHHKRRIIQAPFTDLVWQKLRNGGEIHCATDWENYAEWMCEIFQNDSKWHNLGEENGYAPRPDWRPETKFERRGLNKGHGVWDLRYQKKQQYEQ